MTATWSICTAPSSRGLGRRPLKAETAVRIRSGLPIIKQNYHQAEDLTARSAARILLRCDPQSQVPCEGDCAKGILRDAQAQALLLLALQPREPLRRPPYR